jgi:hypothetical protein
MLEREAHWLEWKRTGCKAYEKSAADGESEARHHPSAKRKRAAAAKVQVGNSELTRLWNLGDNSLESLAEFTTNVPSLAEYLKPVVEQMDPDAGIEVFVFAHPPISPICRTPLFPHLTVYACFSRHFSSPTHPFLPYVAPHFSHISHFNALF